MNAHLGRTLRSGVSSEERRVRFWCTFHTTDPCGKVGTAVTRYLSEVRGVTLVGIICCAQDMALKTIVEACFVIYVSSQVTLCGRTHGACFLSRTCDTVPSRKLQDAHVGPGKIGEYLQEIHQDRIHQDTFEKAGRVCPSVFVRSSPRGRRVGLTHLRLAHLHTCAPSLLRARLFCSFFEWDRTRLYTFTAAQALTNCTLRMCSLSYIRTLMNMFIISHLSMLIFKLNI